MKSLTAGDDQLTLDCEAERVAVRMLEEGILITLSTPLTWKGS